MTITQEHINAAAGINADADEHAEEKRAQLMPLIARKLEEHGYRADIAGEADFSAVCSAVAEMLLRQTRGVLFAGSVGVGKTCAAMAIWKGIFALHGIRAMCTGTKGDLQYLDSDDAMTCEIFIDDVGVECPVNDYGVKSDPFAAFVSRWYHRSDSPLMVTTNLSGNDIRKRYGERVLSRLLSLRIVKLSGADRRGIANTGDKKRATAFSATDPYKLLTEPEKREISGFIARFRRTCRKNGILEPTPEAFYTAFRRSPLYEIPHLREAARHAFMSVAGGGE